MKKVTGEEALHTKTVVAIYNTAVKDSKYFAMDEFCNGSEGRKGYK